MTTETTQETASGFSPCRSRRWIATRLRAASSEPSPSPARIRSSRTPAPERLASPSAIASAASLGGPLAALRASLSAAAACIAVLVSSGAALATDVSLAEVERTPPEFSLETLDGGTVDTAALAGRPWVVNFWATWCAPCIEEMPALNTAWKTLEPAGVGMLAINVGETAEAIGTFLDKVPVDFPILLGDGAKTLPDWDARALPTTLVVDAEGRIVHEAVGPRDWDDPALIARLAALADAQPSSDAK